MVSTHKKSLGMAFPQLFRLLRAAPPAEASTLLQTLSVVLSNAVERGSGPDGEKYRTLKTSNVAIRSKVLEAAGGVQLLTAAGFSKSLEADIVVYKVWFAFDCGFAPMQLVR